MEDKHQSHHNGTSAFLFGLVIGAAATLLFTTKKGRELVKSLTEEGVGRIKQKIEETREQFEDVEDMEEAEDYIEPEERPEKEHHASEKKHTDHHKEEPKKESRKFFRRS